MALLPLFIISDVVVKMKLQVNGILGEYGTAVIDKKDLKQPSLGGVVKPPMQCLDYCITASL